MPEVIIISIDDQHDVYEVDPTDPHAVSDLYRWFEQMRSEAVMQDWAWYGPVTLHNIRDHLAIYEEVGNPA